MPRIKAYASAKSIRENIALKRFHLNILSLAALHIEAQLNVYVMNSYRTDISNIRPLSAYFQLHLFSLSLSLSLSIYIYIYKCLLVREIKTY